MAIASPLDLYSLFREDVKRGVWVRRPDCRNQDRRAKLRGARKRQQRAQTIAPRNEARDMPNFCSGARIAELLQRRSCVEYWFESPNGAERDKYVPTMMAPAVK